MKKKKTCYLAVEADPMSIALRKSRIAVLVYNFMSAATPSMLSTITIVNKRYEKIIKFLELWENKMKNVAILHNL